MRMRVLVGVLAVVAVHLAAGCGDDASAERAVSRCETFLATFCARAYECTGQTYDACVTDARQHVDCGAAVDTRDSYDRCIRDLEAAHCSAFDALPASCQGVILMSY